MNAETPAELINRLRAAGYSQQELAKEAGCDQSTISLLANNKQQVTNYQIMDRLRLLAARLESAPGEAKEELAHE